MLRVFRRGFRVRMAVGFFASSLAIFFGGSHASRPPNPEAFLSPERGAWQLCFLFIEKPAPRFLFRGILKKSGATPPIYPLELETLDSSGAQIGFNSARSFSTPVANPAILYSY